MKAVFGRAYALSTSWFVWLMVSSPPKKPIFNIHFRHLRMIGVRCTTSENLEVEPVARVQCRRDPIVYRVVIVAACRMKCLDKASNLLRCPLHVSRRYVRKPGALVAL